MNRTARRTVHRTIILTLTVYWLIIFVGTHTPVSTPSGVHVGDKVLHFVAYFGLAFLLAWATMKLQPSAIRSLLVLLIVMVYGMLDEWTQSFVATRTAEVGDWIADALGGMAGLGAYYVTQWSCQYLLFPGRAAVDSR